MANDYIMEDQIELVNCKFKSTYNAYSLVGKGVFGKVYHVKSKADNNDYAVKQITMLKDDPNDKYIIREINILKACDHVNVIKYCSAWREQDTLDNKFDNIYIMMEYCKYNLLNVYNYITSIYSRNINQVICPVSYFIILTMVEEILAGLDYLHSMNIMHRDIKETNILVKHYGPHWIKICDFALAKVDESTSEHTVSVGTHSYIAPEVKWGGEYNNPADVFSLGIMLMQFFNVNINNQTVHSELKDVLARMISGKVSDRPSCSQVLTIITQPPIVYDVDIVRTDHHNIFLLDQNEFLKDYYHDKMRFKSTN